MELKNIAGIKKAMQADIGTLTKVTTACSQADTRSGMEGYEDGGSVFTAAAAHFKTQYGVSVEPTLAGMESMLTQLASGLKKIEAGEGAQEILTIMHLGAESRRSEFVVASHKVGGDIHVIESIIANQRDGIDGMEDGGSHFAHVASTIKANYGIEVEPTLAGMESFLGKLKEAFKTMVGKKRVPLKEIIEDVYDLEKGVKVIKENAAQRGFKEGDGTVTLSVPKTYGKGITPEAVAKHATDAAKKAGPNLTKAAAPAKATLLAGLKVFNKYANHAVPETEAEFSKLLSGEFPIKPGHPPYVPSPGNKVEYGPVEVKLLDKAGFDKAIGALEAILDQFQKFAKIVDDVDKGALDYAEIAESKFWDAYWESDETDQLCDAIYFQAVTHGLNPILWNWANEIEPGIKVLEQWINASLK